MPLPDFVDDEVDDFADEADVEPLYVPSAADRSDGFPPVFQYSQDSLQAYLACARRFQLRHLIRQAWPEPINDLTDTVDQDMALGDQFHRLIERHFSGIRVPPPVDQPLAAWWQGFLSSVDRLPIDAPICKPEVSYSVPFGKRRLIAKFDLLTITPGQQITIIDWKTGHQRPNRAALADRLQTAVYQYVAAEALSREYGGDLLPEAVQLIYWFAADPDHPLLFQHSEARHESTRARLEKLIGEIESRTETIWPLTDHLERCQPCTFRVLCDRPRRAESDEIQAESVTEVESESEDTARSLFDDTVEVEL